MEGAGKTTQARLFADWLGEVGISHRLGREPGGTPLGEAIRGVLLDSRGPGMSAESELLLMLAARAAFVREVVRPTLESGAVMVADRFELSTFAYQGVGRGLGVEEVERLNRFATSGLRADVTMVLDVPASLGQARQREGRKERDRIEAEGVSFLEVVRAAYRSLARDHPGAVLLDASPSVDEVHRQVREVLITRFPEHFSSRRG
ncbi:MAG: dTMP kinase [Gemmatimonadetes bacterium]|nr:dTMP kinase [Gemmatimonadota bacterium]